MNSRTVFMIRNRWRTLAPLLHSFNYSSLLPTCLRSPARLLSIHARCCNTVSLPGGPFTLLTGYRAITRRTKCLVQRHWKRCVTAGTLCCSGVLLTRMAASEADSPASSGRIQSLSQTPKDDAMYRVHIADHSSYCEATFSQFTLPEKVYIVLRWVYLTFLFSPAVVLYGLSRLLRSRRLESFAWSYVMRAVQTAGPAFIKLGQWASTRRDLFSVEFCDSLSQLHSSCQPHQWRHTVQTLDEEFGRDWDTVLEISDRQPIGSGCVAQVYKGHLKTRSTADTLNPEGESGIGEDLNRKQRTFFSRILHSWSSKSRREGELEGKKEEEEEGPVPVAVKVLHPGTVQAMERDMLLMRYGAYWMDRLHPDFHWVALKECFSEFSVIMRKQLDMELEAHNLRRFQQIMGDNDCVKFPTPLFPYVTKSVLVESFEPGSHISSYMNNPGGKLQKTLARIGMDVILDMLFIHNFVHGDLHPGNILVQEAHRPRLVLLDCGIATSLTHFDLLQMRALFTAIVKGEGENVADLMLGSQPCPTVEEYRRNMADLVTRGINRLTEIKNTNVSCLFSDLFNILMKHKVRIEPNYTSVVMAITVMEGLGRSLDPNLNLLEAVAPCLLHRVRRDLTAKIVGS